MRFAPSPQRIPDRPQNATVIGKEILDLRRSAWPDDALDKPFCLEVPKLLDQHLATDSRDRAPKILGAPRSPAACPTRAELIPNRGSPLRCDNGYGRCQRTDAGMEAAFRALRLAHRFTPEAG